MDLKAIERNILSYETTARHYRDLAAEDEKKVAELKAEKARREAEAKKTVGQRVAEKNVKPCPLKGPVTYSDGVYFDGFFVPCGSREAEESFVLHLGRFADKVRADTIEECANVADCHGYAERAAREIRALK